MIIFKEKEPVLIVNKLKAPISKKGLGCFTRYPFGKQELI
jgi:hypothetical protein